MRTLNRVFSLVINKENNLYLFNYLVIELRLCDLKHITDHINFTRNIVINIWYLN